MNYWKSENEDIILVNRDCLDAMDSMIEKDVKVDAIITDPPYLMNYRSNRRVKSEKFDYIKNDKNSKKLIEESICMSDKILNNNSSIFMFCSWHHIDFFKQEFQKYFKLKNVLVWVKNNHGTGDLKGSYAPKHEFILFGEKGRCIRQPNRKRTPDVLFYDKIASNKLKHSTEKPVDLLNQFILDYTNENDLILDPFMGSGTTGVACKNLNRKFIGIELDEGYYNIAKERIDNNEE